MFSLTAHKDLRDSTVIKDFEFLLATKIVGNNPAEVELPKSPVDFAAPKAIWARGTPWNTCGVRRKWLGIDDDTGQFFERKLWTLQFPEGCIQHPENCTANPCDALKRGRFQKLIQNEPFSKKYTQPYSKPIFDQIWCSQPASHQTRVFWSPPLLPEIFFGPAVDEAFPANGKYLICIFDVKKHATSENFFREFLLDWVLYSGYNDAQQILVDAFETFMKSQKIFRLTQLRDCAAKPTNLDKFSQNAEAFKDASAKRVVELINHIKSNPDLFVKRCECCCAHYETLRVCLKLCQVECIYGRQARDETYFAAECFQKATEYVKESKT
jgi:hypothetical protein